MTALIAIGLLAVMTIAPFVLGFAMLIFNLSDWEQSE